MSTPGSSLRFAPVTRGRNLKPLYLDLLVLDLSTCARCVPADRALKRAVAFLEPVAIALGIQLILRTRVIRTREEALRLALRSSPTIRIHGRDIAQDIRESACESCGEIAGGAAVQCREWHYKGNVYTSPPLPLLLEALMDAMLHIDTLPVIEPEPLPALPENLEGFFRGLEGGLGCN